MALQLTNKKRFVPEDSGNRDSDNPVVCKLHRIKLRDMFDIEEKVRSAFGNKANEEGVDVEKLNPDEARKFAELLEHVITTYTSEWEAVNVDGADLTEGKDVAEQCIDQTTMPLFGEVFNELLSSMAVSEGESKNLDADSERENSGSVITAPTASEVDSKKKETAGGNLTPEASP